MTEKQSQIKARFKQVVKHLDLDRQLLAGHLGYKKRYLDQILSADKNLSDAVLLKFIKRYKRVNEEWLMNGRGEMLNEEIVKDYQIEGGEPRTLEDLEREYKADPFAGLKEMIGRMQGDIESLKAEVAALRAAKDESPNL